jgi:cell division protein FtsQ
MDGRGRLAQSLNWIARLRCSPAAGIGARRAGRAPSRRSGLPPSGFRRALQRLWIRTVRLRLPRGVGIGAATIIILSALCYGVVKGDHIETIIDTLRDARDQAANALGFRIVTLAVNGHRHMSREEVLATAGVTGRTSLLFLDVDAARERLKTNPWIADATVLKLLPGELQIGIKERAPFALWQKDRRVTVIAGDGTVLETYVVPQLFTLPLVVGRGAETRAKGFLALLDRHPALRAQVLASIFIGERRWNLRLRNGLDIRLPENNVARALDRLATLDRDAKLLSRDLTVIDLRLPDRVTVRLSEGPAQARLDSLKKKAKKKGGKA